MFRGVYRASGDCRGRCGVRFISFQVLEAVRVAMNVGWVIHMQAITNIEDATVRAFIVPAKRDRYAALLANPAKRAKILDLLNHCRDFDARYATALASTTDIPALLRSRGAAQTCHVISDFREIDGREMPLDDAVAGADESGLGTLLCCVPGRLAYYVGERGEQRLLLMREAG